MAARQNFFRTFFIHGEGGIQAVQARLAVYGLCSNTKWEPGPPRWRFIYETNLTQADLELKLSDLIRRYDLRIEIKSTP